ncbi:MAG: aminotransferase class I/II-fold pyridoxal phosphate-dependent enzyme [Lachnospiraceae bacterium]|nr:aminotransferase class I/II-fold pyridoxal phosphate-dependent enzyme [Lachnospiraceae bacterium]
MSIYNSEYHFDTLKIKAGYDPKEHNNAVSVPIYETASYEIGTAERYDRLAAAEESGNLYSRVSNPTIKVLEDRIAALDHAEAAVAVGSGVAAITFTLLALAEYGGRILTTYQLYGGVVHHMNYLLPRFGVQFDKVENGSSVEAFEKAITKDTKAIYVESVTNPMATVTDIEALGELAHRHNIPLVVDNTLPTPYLLNPIDHGADIVVYSATKGISGHGNAIGGLVVDSGKFNWNNGKFPQFTDENIAIKGRNDNGRSYLEVFGKSAFAGKIRTDYLTNFGAALSPFNAYLILLGIETISERVEKQVKNAREIAKFLESRPEVDWVSYPGSSYYKYEVLAKKYCPNGVGQLYSFGLKGTEENIYKFVNAVKVFSYQLNLGDARSLVANVSRTSHGELTEEELKRADIPANAIRISIGIEDVRDLKNDLARALDIAFHGAAQEVA